MSLPPYKFVTTPTDWQACLAKLEQESRLAIDLESNSMFAYREEVCLIQISIPGQDYIIDPLAPLTLDGLGDLIADGRVEKVFHAAEYDLILMKRQYGWELTNLFDTMWATRILGYARVGLANVLEAKFQVKLDKRFQRSNWCSRPLSAPQLSYAQHDTHFLLDLRNVLEVELEAKGRLAEAQEIFAEQSRIALSDNDFDTDSFWSINGVYNLTPDAQAVLKALNIYRDEQASRYNKPLFKIFGNKTMLAIARAMPAHLNELRSIPGMSQGQIRRFGRSIIQIVRDHKGTSAPRRRRRQERPPDDVYNRYEKMHAWRKNRAIKRGVESDVIISRETLWQLARTNPQTMAELEQLSSLGPVRRQLYGQEILEVLRRLEKESREA